MLINLNEVCSEAECMIECTFSYSRIWTAKLFQLPAIAESTVARYIQRVDNPSNEKCDICGF